VRGRRGRGEGRVGGRVEWVKGVGGSGEGGFGVGWWGEGWEDEGGGGGRVRRRGWEVGDAGGGGVRGRGETERARTYNKEPADLKNSPLKESLHLRIRKTKIYPGVSLAWEVSSKKITFKEVSENAKGGHRQVWAG